MRKLFFLLFAFCSQWFYLQNIVLNKVDKVNDNQDKFFYSIAEPSKSEFLGEDALQRLQRQFFVNIRYSIANEKKVGKKNIVSRINKIVREETVQRAVFEYPINEIGFKQRIFLYMLKNKLTLLLAMIV